MAQPRERTAEESKHEARSGREDYVAASQTRLADTAIRGDFCGKTPYTMCAGRDADPDSGCEVTEASCRRPDMRFQAGELGIGWRVAVRSMAGAEGSLGKTKEL
jgi:hypothetical protein